MLAKQTPQKTVDKLGCSESISSACFFIGTRRIKSYVHQVIWGNMSVPFTINCIIMCIQNAYLCRFNTVFPITGRLHIKILVGVCVLSSSSSRFTYINAMVKVYVV